MERPDYWYEPDVEPETYNPSESIDVEHCEFMLKKIINAVYLTGDIATLEDCLEEVAGQFDLKLPKTEPVLGSTGSVNVDSTLESWLQFNQGYNECLRNKATR